MAGLQEVLRVWAIVANALFVCFTIVYVVRSIRRGKTEKTLARAVRAAVKRGNEVFYIVPSCVTALLVLSREFFGSDVQTTALVFHSLLLAVDTANAKWNVGLGFKGTAFFFGLVMRVPTVWYLAIS